MEFKGTKGDWRICESELQVTDKGKSIVIFSKERKKTEIKEYPYAMVCAISPLSLFNKEDEANAKLIAAAPGLLEALQEVLENDLSTTNFTKLSVHTRAFVQNRINKAIA